MKSSRKNSPTMCASTETWRRFCHGRLTDEESDQLGIHLEQCSQCLEVVKAVVRESDTVVNLIEAWCESLQAEPELRELTETARANDLTRWSETGQGAPEERTLPSDIPRVLDEYRLLESLGEGAVGRVFRAEHRRLAKIVAVKILAPKRGLSATMISRFEREIRAVGKICDPHVIAATDAREAEGIHFLVMEYAPGLDAGQLVGRLGRLPIREATEIVRQAALGVEAAHAHSLIHRDLKPSNLLVTNEGIVKVLDLGLVKLRRFEESDGHSNVVGTPHFMAPEQWEGGGIDARTDVYGLGCTLFTLLAGHPPYEGSGWTHRDISRAHSSAPVPQLTRSNGDVPPALTSLLTQTLAKKMEDRPNSAGSLAARLEPFASGADLGKLVQLAREFTLSDTLVGRKDSTIRLNDVSHVHSKPGSKLLMMLLAGALAVALGVCGVLFLPNVTDTSGPAWRVVQPPDTADLWHDGAFDPKIHVTSTSIDIEFNGLTFFDVGSAVDANYTLETSFEPQQRNPMGVFWGGRTSADHVELFSVHLRTVDSDENETEYSVKMYWEHFQRSEIPVPLAEQILIKWENIILPGARGRIELQVQLPESGPVKIFVDSKLALQVEESLLVIHRPDFHEGVFGVRSDAQGQGVAHFSAMRRLNF